jgi:hypothetical protein
MLFDNAVSSPCRTTLNPRIGRDPKRKGSSVAGGTARSLLVYFRGNYGKYVHSHPVHSPTNALFINLVKSLKFTLKYTIILPLYVSVFNEHNQGA